MSMKPALPFIYSRLAASDIRLLLLFPGKQGDRPRCSLSHVTLHIKDWDDSDEDSDTKKGGGSEVEKEPIYEALSYMWGPDEIYDFILVDDRKFSIRRNLWDALQRLRCPERNRVFWIDAICIDQDNFPERSAQVSKMGSIYSKASQVIAWIGESTPDTDRAMDALSVLGSETTRFIPTFLGDESRLRLSDNLYAIQVVLCRPYWRRLWIVQELFMAGSVLIQCGAKRIWWNAIVMVCDDTFSLQPSTISDAAEVVRLVNEGRKNLPYVLQTCRKLQCQDVRDKIYGLLGLIAEPAVRSLKPDYRKDPAQLYGEVMRLAMISMPEREASLQYDLTACSWWLQEILEQPFWYPKLGHYERMVSSESYDNCGVDVAEHDKVFCVGPAVNGTNLMDVNFEVSKEWDSFEERLSAGFPYLSALDQPLNYKEIWNWACSEIFSNSQVLLGIVDILQTRTSQWAYRLFVTVGGDVGLAPSTINEGDILFNLSSELNWKHLGIFRIRPAKSFLIGRALILPDGSRPFISSPKIYTVNLTIDQIQVLTR